MALHSWLPSRPCELHRKASAPQHLHASPPPTVCPCSSMVALPPCTCAWRGIVPLVLHACVYGAARHRRCDGAASCGSSRLHSVWMQAT